jgi:Flp pilus assembly protein CpaB
VVAETVLNLIRVIAVDQQIARAHPPKRLPPPLV